MIIGVDELFSIRQKHAGKKIVLTSGTFDLFHIGHLNYLEQLRQYGDIVVVMLSGDNRVKARKGQHRPIIPEKDRANILDSLRAVDFVFIDPSQLGPNETDPIHSEILQKLQPDYYITDGPDPRFLNIMDKSKFIILGRPQPNPSTTAIIESIINNN